MHALLPLAVFLLGSSSPGDSEVQAPAVVQQAQAERTFTLPLRVPEAQLKSLLSKELGKKKLLKNFQVVTSKFTNGRVVLDSLDVQQGERQGTVRLEAHARLRFDRKQLGIRWRGLKSHKKWFVKGAKDAARVRVTCTLELGALKDSEESLGASLTDIRVKIVSRLRPVRRLTARFDVDDKEFAWTPEGGLFDHLVIASLRIAGVERDALRLEVDVARTPR